MPRGVYDRSKTAAVKTAAPKAPKAEKKARAPYGSKKAAKAVPQFDVPFAETATNTRSYSLSELANLRAAFSGPQANVAIIGKIDTLVVRQLDAIIGSFETAAETKPAKVAQVQSQAPAPVQMPAPIQAAAPFNPVVPANGQA